MSAGVQAEESSGMAKTPSITTYGAVNATSASRTSSTARKAPDRTRAGSYQCAAGLTRAGQHGIPASTLTDNGMVFTTRLPGGSLAGTRGRNGFEHELRRLGVVQ